MRETRLSFEGETAHIETDDPDVVAQLEELGEAERLDAGQFALPAAAARIHFPNLAA